MILDQKYTEEEAEFVKRNYQKLTTKQIAKRLGRSINSVKSFKYRFGFQSKAMALKSRFQTLTRRKVYEKNKIKRLENEKRDLSGEPRIDSEESIIAEMKALINLVELTDNKSIRYRAKVKLMQLSGIPKDNPFARNEYLW